MREKISSFVAKIINTLILVSVIFNSNCFADEDIKTGTKIQESNMIKGLFIVNMQKGDAFFKKENYFEALKQYTMAINNAPHDPRPYYKVAECLKKLNQPDQAEEMIKEAKVIESEQTTQLEHLQ